MMTTGERIKFFRDKKEWTQTDLARKTGLDQSYLSKLEKNKAGWSAEGIEIIAHVLQVKLGVLVDRHFDPNAPHKAAPDHLIPIHDFIQAGSPREATGSFRGDEIEGYIPCELPGVRDLFGLKVRGRSMEPDFLDGDMVIFRRGLQPHPGDFVAATEEDLGSCFKMYKEPGEFEDGRPVFRLVSLNDSYPSYISTKGHWNIDGTLVRHIRDYRK